MKEDKEDNGLFLILSIIIVFVIMYLILPPKVNSVDDRLSDQCKQLGGAWIRDNSDDFYCVALIKLDSQNNTRKLNDGQ